VPGQRGALDAHREFRDAREDRELAEFVGVLGTARDQPVKALEQRERSSLERPLTACVIIDAEALLIAQPLPVNATSFNASRSRVT
jgi:hypothetical protein